LIKQEISIRKLLSTGSHLNQKIRNKELLLIGCSAGGFNLLVDLLLQVPANFPVPVVVVIHRSRKYKSSMENLLHKKANVVVKLAEDKEQIKKGYIYFAPLDYHLLIEPDHTFSLDYSEPVFFCRPSIDVTFESASDVYLEKVIGVLLSGANEDGAQGMYHIEQNDGLVIAQDPDSAEISTMPQAAISKCKTILILKNEELIQFINQIATIKN
jgi:two-component system chemotaxis response regulator CheB